MTTTIHIAENDGIGNRCGKATTVCFYHSDGEEIRFSTFPNLTGVDIQHYKIGAIKEIRIGGKSYTRFGFTQWVGNNQYNAYSISFVTAMCMMRDLHISNEWHVLDDNIGGIEEKLRLNTLNFHDMGWTTDIIVSDDGATYNPKQLGLF